MNSKNKILSFAMLVLLTGCAADEWQQSRQGSSNLIEFTVSSSPSIDVTRGNDHSLKLSGYTTDLWLLPTVTPTSELDATRGTQFGSKSVLSSFGVSAYQYNNSEGISDKRPEFFYNKEAVRNSITGKYNIAQEYYWPSSDECLTFMAYAPYGSTYVKLSDVDDSERAVGPQKLYFTIASDVTEQIDLMTATAAGLTLNSSAKPSVSMQFQHQLSGIRFVAGSQFPHQGYVQTITLKNVYASGTYTLGDGSSPGSWSYGSRDNYVAGTADQLLTGKVGQAITATDQTFLMLPCSFADDDDASIEINFWDGYATHSVEASLAGVTWEAGKTYTYELSSHDLTKLKIESIAFASTVSGAPRTNWQTGDKVGLYVVRGYDESGKADGRKLRYANIPVTCTVTTVGGQKVPTWSIDHTTSQGNVYQYAGDSYYFYYPYKEGTPEGYPNECNELDATAPIFFSSVINAHTVEADQSGIGSAVGNYEKSDLQVAKAVVPEALNSELPAATIKATMERQVGLAVIELPAVSILTDSIMLNNVKQANQPRTNVKASASFSGNIPRQSGELYYFFVKPSSSATVFNSETGLTDSWRSSVDVSLGAGETGYYKAYSKRAAWTYINSVVWKYDYQGVYKTFTNPWTGTYKMECWGAGSFWKSGKVDANGGGYVAGDISLSTTRTFYVFVGEKTKTEHYVYAFNGGGRGKTKGGSTGPTGSGATDIRLEAVTSNAANWSNFNSLLSRIIVAGGGGTQTGDVYSGGESRGHAGGLSGYSSRAYGYAYANIGAYGGSQTAGGNPWSKWHSATQNGTPGAFGYGGDGGYSGSIASGGGGGGGYYGGAGGTGAETGVFPGAGGSSYISGHAGCNSVSSAADGATSSNRLHRGVGSIHYSGLSFTNIKMIDGAGYLWPSNSSSKGSLSAMPNPDGGNYASGYGHNGHGFCRITYTRQ